MKKFSLLALGIAILTLGGCGASTPSPDEMGQIEIQNETQLQNIKLGVIAHLTRGEILCGQDGISRYQTEIDAFNASHTGLQIELVAGDQDEEGIIGKLYTEDWVAGVARVSCGTPVEEIRNNLLKWYEKGERGQVVVLGLAVPWKSLGVEERDRRENLITAFTDEVNAFNASRSELLIQLKVIDGECENGKMTSYSPQWVQVYANVACPKFDMSTQDFMNVAYYATQGLLELFPDGELSGSFVYPNCRRPEGNDLINLCQSFYYSNN